MYQANHFKKEIVPTKGQRDFANNVQQEKESKLHVATAGTVWWAARHTVI